MNMQSLKLSASILALNGLRHSIVRDLKVSFWSLFRSRQIGHYLRTNAVRKLHLGASSHLLPGWLNTDYDAGNGLVYLDATRRFPLPDNSMDYIFSEHMIEHIDYEQGRFMLSECFRVLKPGGTIRTSTPNMEISLQLYGEPRDTELRAYQDWFVNREFPHLLDNPNRGVFILNRGFRAWGHQFLYDKPTLKEAIGKAGFTDLRFFSVSESDDPELRNIEGHGDHNGTQRWNDIEAFVIEAVKPVEQKQKSLLLELAEVGYSR